MRWLFGALLLEWFMLGGQTPPASNQEQQDLVFSVTSTLVQLDAVVTDAKGRNVANLRPEDFHLLLDGQAQQLTHFSYVALDSAPPPAQALRAQANGATTNLETEIQIVRDGRKVYSASGKIVDVPGSGPAVFGALRLTDKLAPGDYYLHVIATDPRGGKNAAADQWTDFEVLPASD